MTHKNAVTASLVALGFATLGVYDFLQAQCGAGGCQPPQQTEASGTITFTVQSSLGSLSDDFNRHAGYWNTAFSTAGSNVRFVGVTSGGAVTVSLDDSVCPNWAQSQVGAGGGTFIKLCSLTLQQSWDFIENTISHEFGHHAGFGHGTCAASESVMTVVQPHEMTQATAKQPGCADTGAVIWHYRPQPPPCDTDPGWPGCSPLLIDTNGDGFRFTRAGRGVLFDIDADGELDQVAWTTANSDDAWLALDRNGNGVVDDGRELFGNVTPPCPLDTTSAPNGFEALRFLESGCYGPSLQDGMIDARDAAFGRLLLWRDLNHDGKSSPNELTSVIASPLRGIDLDYRIIERKRRGNAIRQVSVVSWGESTRRIVDVWLAAQ